MHEELNLMEKEAFIGAAIKGAKKGLGSIKAKRAQKVVTPNTTHASINNPLNSKKFKAFDANEMKANEFQNVKDSAGIIQQMGLGAIRMVPGQGSKNVANKLSDNIAKAKMGLRKFDHEFTGKVKNKLGLKNDGVIDRFTSKTDNIKVGTQKGPTGLTEDVNVAKKRHSMAAPIKHTSGFVLPMLGYSYISDKFEEAADNKAQQQMQQQMQQPYMPKNAYSVIDNMEKQAAISKIAELESELETSQGLLKFAAAEKNVLLNDNKSMMVKVAAYEDTINHLQNEIEKKASDLNELQQRMFIRERTVNSVKLAETMLEHGIIKQAEFDDKVDYLVSCDNDTFVMHEKIASMNNGEKGLEKEAFMLEYRGKPSSRSFDSNFSSAGQTIDEAARDLLRR